MFLRDAVRAGDVARLRELGGAIEGEFSEAVERDGATPLLAVAATLGYAEAVSVLITAGYNPAARSGGDSRFGVLHFLAAAETGLSAERRLEVLRSFGDAVETRGTVYDWNQEDAAGRHPLDLLRGAHDAAERGGA